jgi:hypothetical protein
MLKLNNEYLILFTYYIYSHKMALPLIGRQNSRLPLIGRPSGIVAEKLLRFFLLLAF